MKISNSRNTLHVGHNLNIRKKLLEKETRMGNAIYSINDWLI